MEKVELILVPGLLCDASLWRAQLDALGDVAEMWVADHTRSTTMAGVARGESPEQTERRRAFIDRALRQWLAA